MPFLIVDDKEGKTGAMTMMMMMRLMQVTSFFIMEETFHFPLSLSSLSTVTVPALLVHSRLAS
jgi:hypothetical protein